MPALLRAFPGANRGNQLREEMKLRSRSRAFILIDTLIGAGILGLGATAFWMMLPTIDRSQRLSQHRARASQIASRAAEKLQPLTVTALPGTTLKTLHI